MNCGKKKEIHGYFDKFIKKRYYDMDQDAINFEDFYQMSEQFFKYRGLPVLFRDILYQLLGYFYAVSDSSDETLNFYL